MCSRQVASAASAATRKSSSRYVDRGDQPLPPGPGRSRRAVARDPALSPVGDSGQPARLRDRGSDIDLLAQLSSTTRTRKVRPQGLLGRSMQFLHAYAWPGNVRELKNLVQRALSAGRRFARAGRGARNVDIDPQHAAAGRPRDGRPGHQPGRIRAQPDLRGLERWGGNKTRTAEIWGSALNASTIVCTRYGGGIAHADRAHRDSTARLRHRAQRDANERIRR